MASMEDVPRSPPRQIKQKGGRVLGSEQLAQVLVFLHDLLSDNSKSSHLALLGPQRKQTTLSTCQPLKVASNITQCSWNIT